MNRYTAEAGRWQANDTIRLCPYCKARRVRYRIDYPASSPKAYFLHHAKGCPRSKR